MDGGISRICIKNFGVLPDIDLDRLLPVNLVIGENCTGKTSFLKLMYAVVKSMEVFRRGDDVRSFSDIISEKLRWTFQVDKIGDLVTKGAEGSCAVSMQMTEDNAGFTFSQSASGNVGTAEHPAANRNANSVFIPAKEVLSLFAVILKSREIDSSFGFDDTYYDLVKALRVAPGRGRNYAALANSRKKLKDIISGKVDFDEKRERWYYKDSRQYRYSIGATSEGIKKISILDRLFANGYVDRNSVIFIDELESALHPDAISGFLDMIFDIASALGTQFFISSHSYFVIKKLALLAMKEADKVGCISLKRNSIYEFCDLHNGLPQNSIIDAAISLYEEEVDSVLS